jgi:Leucine-rich repeat (LRR) protein
MTVLALSYNQIVGQVSDMPSSLFFLGLAGNNLTGPIPASLGLLGKLTSLDLSYNSLSGQVSHQILVEISQNIHRNFYENWF